ncbi:hypothetical protein S7711_11482 [Stachybotrys chartarum IBT 7711]|uniref:Uncharacterized protein n=1 Tax=Stachybotrys chartarum (strain CBS 109288 / IBT 7711) TaxID=1280523 RepID=A0A084AZS9_STACB|nr:hypothetical protein S7711_11482 [Stachybotrys chartarum IBT 7711]
MDMLHPLDNIDFPPLEHAILNIFKGALEYPADIEAQASKIANDIVYCCSNVNSEEEIDGTFLAIWDVTFDLASYITPNHKWQQSLIRALEIIRQREGSTSPEHARPPKDIEWGDLPEFSMRLRERWELRATEGDEAVVARLETWKNINSFVSRLVGSGFTQVFYLAIWEIRQGLEEPATKTKALLNCRVWIATEWILCCSKVLLENMKSPVEELAELQLISQETGPLFGKSLPPRSLQRWEFWKKRLAEISEESESLGIDTEVKQRVEETLKHMESL